MANHKKTCKGKKSDSSCTCALFHECQDDMNFSKYERNDTVTAQHNNECSSECINCKLLNRLYILLEEIVENRQTFITEEINKISCDNDKNMSSKNKFEETYKIKENLMRINEMDDKNYKDFNYNNTCGSIKLNCDCNKYNSEKNPNFLSSNKKEHHTPQTSKRNENTLQSSTQCWHSVGEIKKYNQVDCACQCSSSKKDSSTQDYFTEKESFVKNNTGNTNKFECADSAVNRDTQNNSCIQNFCCSLLNDPSFRDAIKLMHSPNLVVLSNRCSYCNKCNLPLDKTSVTTNTSKLIVTSPEKNNEVANLKTPSTTGIDHAKREFSFKDPTFDMKTQGLSSINRSSKDLPLQSNNNKDVPKNTSSIFKQATEFTVASALVSKNSKKKGTPKGKKRKSRNSYDSNEPLNELQEKRDFINNCCQTDNNANEEKCQYVLQTVKKIKDASICCNINKCNAIDTVKKIKDVSICCDMNKCNAISTKLVEEESNTAIQNQNNNSCNCTDIQNFISIITELCAQLNKNKEKSNEFVSCECNDKNNTTQTPAQLTPDVHTTKDDCLEILRLAEQITEIHLKSNQNKSGAPNYMPQNDYRRSVDLVRTASSDCDLNNCIHLNPIPSHNIAENLEECNCKCPCKKPTKCGKKDVCPAKKEKKYRNSVNASPKRATKKLNEINCGNLNNWTQQYPSASPQKCTCDNYECTEETEIGCVNYNISDFSKVNDMETCPQLRRIIKDCLCGSKNCYCHNAKLNEIKTTAKLERLADEVINTISPCNCKGQQCTCTNLNATDPGIRRYTTRQVCFSGKEKKGNKLFDKDVNGNPCLKGSKSETDLYIKKLVNKKTTKNKVCLKKVIPSSAKKFKTLTMKPLLPIPNTPCTHLYNIDSLFPEIYQALSKIKELTNWETLPQEIVEIVIDKILKREIKNALQQMREGVLKIDANDNSNSKNNTNILNLLLEDKIKSVENIKEFQNNVLDKRSKNITQNSSIDKPTQHNCCEEIFLETTNLTEDKYNNNNVTDKIETLSVNQNDFDANKKPILVQINIEKEKKSRNNNTPSIALTQKQLDENSCVSLKTNMSSSSIYITKNKLEAIKDLITLGKNKTPQDWEDNETDSSSILSLKETNQPISININIQMDKDKNINLKDSVMNSDEVKTKISSTFSLSKENTYETTQTNTSKELEKSKIELENIRKLMQDLQEKNKSMNDLQEKNKSINDLQQKKETNADPQETTCLFIHENKSELPLLDDFLAMNKKMKVKRIKIIPKNTKKTNKQ